MGLYGLAVVWLSIEHAMPWWCQLIAPYVLVVVWLWDRRFSIMLVGGLYLGAALFVALVYAINVFVRGAV